MMMLIVFPPFIAGYHLVVTELGGLSAQWSTDKLTRWDETLEDPPHTSCNREREHVSAWVSDDALWVIPPSKSRLSLHAIDHQTAPRAPLDTRYLTVRCGTSGPITFRQAQARILDVGDGLRYDPPVGLGLRIPLKDATRIDARVHLDGQKVPATRLKTGRWGEEAGEEGKIEGTRSLGWIPIYIIVHLGLIALPEEWFFRGYLQTRIDQVMGTRWHWFGVQCGPGLVLSSAAFALLHPVLIPGFNRLLVFFPGLLFGWLRARTGNIGASVMFHAACNLLLAIVSGFYS